MLKLNNIEVGYGSTAVLHGVTIEVPEGKTVALVGANGAGKSTILKTIAGLLRPTRGTIELGDTVISRLSPQAIVSRGISLVPEGRQLFPALTVLENLHMGAYLRRDRVNVVSDIKWVKDLFPVLGRRFAQRAATLSGGEQQMLAIARALMARPKLLMVDELSLGLAPLVAKSIFETLEVIRKEGVTVLMVEQQIDEALRFAHFGYVVVTGEVVLSGTGTELLESPAIKAAYLGSN